MGVKTTVRSCEKALKKSNNNLFAKNMLKRQSTSSKDCINKPIIHSAFGVLNFFIECLAGPRCVIFVSLFTKVCSTASLWHESKL